MIRPESPLGKVVGLVYKFEYQNKSVEAREIEYVATTLWFNRAHWKYEDREMFTRLAIIYAKIGQTGSLRDLAEERVRIYREGNLSPQEIERREEREGTAFKFVREDANRRAVEANRAAQAGYTVDIGLELFGRSDYGQHLNSADNIVNVLSWRILALSGDGQTVAPKIAVQIYEQTVKKYGYEALHANPAIQEPLQIIENFVAAMKHRPIVKAAGGKCSRLSF
jgi:hypothetical protein